MSEASNTQADLFGSLLLLEGIDLPARRSSVLAEGHVKMADFLSSIIDRQALSDCGLAFEAPRRIGAARL